MVKVLEAGVESRSDRWDPALEGWRETALMSPGSAFCYWNE